MAGNREGGKRAAATNKQLYGPDFYKRVGHYGGMKSRGGGFALDYIDEDGLNGSQRARAAGRKGGLAVSAKYGGRVGRNIAR